MHVVNADIEAVFTKVADLLDVAGANPFRIRAYRNAALTIGRLSRDVADMISRNEHLTELPGIGSDLAGKIREIVETGRLGFLDRLEKQSHASFSELMEIPGLGPRKVKVLYDALDIRNLDDLEKAAERGDIEHVAGFGRKSRDNILKEIGRRKERHRRIPWPVAMQLVRPLVSYLEAFDGVRRVAVAGSFRRCRETVGDLDVVVNCRRGPDTIRYFTGYEDVADVLSSGTTRSSVVLRSGIQVDLRVVPSVSWGAALLYFTGSREHNIAVRKIAMDRGLKINEYGVFRDQKRIAGKSESEVYSAIDLPFIPPEIRENRGELEAAKNHALPDLVGLDDIRGDLHMHTRKTDGRNSIREMAEAAVSRGYEYIAVTEHSRHVAIAHGLDAAALARHIEEIDRVNGAMQDITVLKGVEVDILEDGSLDLPDEILGELDVVICAVHYQFGLSSRKQTRRIIRAMEHPCTNILAHPTGRLISRREPCEVDMAEIMKSAVDCACILEINAAPERLDLDDRHCRAARQAGVKVVISSDAHSVDGLDSMAYGVNQARRGWLEKGDVANTLALPSLLRLLEKP